MPSGSALEIAFGAVGLAVGIVADRLAARWPRHESGTVRRLDWRTFATAAVGTLAFAALPGRWSAAGDLAVLGVWFAALVVLLATDLDQRLLPDVITLPLIPVCLALVVLGWDPLLAGKSLAVPSALAAGLGAPLILVVTNALFKGGLGLGDVKLAASLGLMAGVSHLVAGLIAASILGSIVLVALLATRRIGLRTYIPFGPILILGGILAAIAP